MPDDKIPPVRMLRTTAYLVLGKDRYGAVKVKRALQSEPTLEKGERMLRIALEIDDAMWTPAPTPGTTIQVHAPVYPDPIVLASEWPQSSLADRPEPSDG